MRGLQSVTTGQRLLEGVEFAHAVRRGDIAPDRPPNRATGAHTPHQRARAVASTFEGVARLLRFAR